MSIDAAGEMKTQLRGDLRTAMKDRNALAARVLRSLVAALDNAEAPTTPAGQAAMTQHAFASGSAEVERLRLDREQVRGILLAELQERERAASEFARLELPDRASVLREEADVIRPYLE